MESTIWSPPGVSTRRGFLLTAGVTLAVLALAQPAAAWWGDTHGLLTRAAVQALPQEVPAFFREGAETAAHISFDPDVAKNRRVPHVRHGEHPEHFADIELLQGEELPDQRYDFIALCHTLGIAPDEAGFAPYAITEYVERLAVAFAEHRKWPQNGVIQVKCLVYAGFLGHYAEDIVQPLHATIHYNGRVGEDGSRTGAGIHEKVDSLIERIGLTAEELAEGVQARAVEGELFAAVRSRLEVDDFADARARVLYIALEDCYRHDQTDTEHLLLRLEPPELRSLVAQKLGSDEFTVNADAYVSEGIRHVKSHALERKRDRLLEQVRQAERAGASQVVTELLADKIYLDSELNKLRGEAVSR